MRVRRTLVAAVRGGSRDRHPRPALKTGPDPASAASRPVTARPRGRPGRAGAYLERG